MLIVSIAEKKKVENHTSAMLHIMSALIIAFRTRQFSCLTMKKKWDKAISQMPSKRKRSQYLLELEMCIVCEHFPSSISVVCLCIPGHCLQSILIGLEFSKEIGPIESMFLC